MQRKCRADRIENYKKAFQQRFLELQARGNTKYYKNKPWRIDEQLFSDPTAYLRKVATM
jgi:hypothetical protein